MLNFLKNVTNRAQAKKTGAMEQYKQLCRKAAAKGDLNGADELAAETVLRELGITPQEFVADVEAVQQLASLEKLAATLPERQAARETARQKLLKEKADHPHKLAAVEKMLRDADDTFRKAASSASDANRAQDGIADLQRRYPRVIEGGAVPTGAYLCRGYAGHPLPPNSIACETIRLDMLDNLRAAGREIVAAPNQSDTEFQGLMTDARKFANGSFYIVRANSQARPMVGERTRTIEEIKSHRTAMAHSWFIRHPDISSEEHAMMLRELDEHFAGDTARPVGLLSVASGDGPPASPILRDIRASRAAVM